MKKILLLATVVLWTTSLFAVNYNITFYVNMNDVNSSFTTPEVNGNFNGWCGGCAQMTDVNNDGIWEITISLAAGNYEYKFAYDSWAGQETLVPGSPCTLTTGMFTNRVLTVTQDQVLPIVCWGSCSNCSGLEQMDLPVTFDASGVEYGLIGFGGADASTIVADPVNASNTVAKVIKSATAELWAGTTVTGPAGLGFSTPVPFTATSKKMTVRVYSPHAGIPVRLKVEEHSNATHSVETEATVTVANGWQTLEFNFANHVSGTSAINLTYTYDKASIFFNFGTTGAVAGEKTYYFDDVKFRGKAVGTWIPVSNFNLMKSAGETATPSISASRATTFYAGGEATAFPNPSADYFLLNTASLSMQNGLIRIYDLTGKLMETYSVQNETTFEVGRTLPSGVYFAKIEAAGNVLQVLKLMKN